MSRRDPFIVDRPSSIVKNEQRAFALIELLVVALIAWSVTLSSAAQATAPTVVLGSNASWLEHHAVRELTKYVEQILGHHGVPIVLDSGVSRASDGDLLLVVGRPSSNEVCASLAARGLVDFSALKSEESFLIQGVEQEGRRLLVISGGGDLGTLYGVYDYLDRYCEVGFFMDGERVPKHKSLPWPRQGIVQNPHFPYRMGGWRAPGPSVPYAFPKIEGQIWSVAQYENLIDWLLKNKFNLTGLGIDPVASGMGDHWGYGGNEPMIFDSDARKLGFKAIVDYGRQRALRFIYPLSPYPRPPEAYHETYQYFGTDHLYVIPGTESRTDEDTLKSYLEQVQAIDPEGRPVIDTWSMWYCGYTKDQALNYIDRWPHDILVYDTAADWGGTWERADYFGGREWCYGNITSFTSWDLLHTRIKQYVEDLQRLEGDPKADRLVGVFLVPEQVQQNYDYLWGYAMGKLAWDPGQVDYDALLQDFVRRRFGAEKEDEMLECVRWLERFNNEERVKVNIAEGHFVVPWYRNVIGGWLGPLVGSKSWPGPGSPRERKLAEDISLLRNSVRYGLLAQDALAKDPLYESFMTELVRTYIGELAGRALMRMGLEYEAATECYAAGNIEEGDEHKANFNAERPKLQRYLQALENLLATRDDYRLAHYMNDVLERPGTLPNAERAMKFYPYILGGYMRTECLEVLHQVYIPETKAVLLALTARLRNRNPEIIDTEDEALQSAYNRIQERYLHEPLFCSDYRGSTIEALQEACDLAEKQEEWPPFPPRRAHKTEPQAVCARTMDVPQFSPPALVVDGNLDSDWTKPDSIFLDRREQYHTLAPGGLWGGPEDLSGRVWSTWDDDNFYLAVVVRDNVIVDGDAVAVEIRPLVTPGARLAEPPVVQFRLTKEEPCPPLLAEGKVQAAGDTLTYEARLPASALGLEKLDDGIMLRLAVRLLDTDESAGKPKGQLIWSGRLNLHRY